MKNFLNLSCLFVISLFICADVSAQSTSWKGTTNTFWNNAANWTNGIPDSNKNAILGDANFTGINQPKVNVLSYCKSVTIGGVRATTLTFTRALNIFGNLTINTNGTVIHPGVISNLAGDFTNNGIYSAIAAASTLTLNGRNQVIGGSTITTFRRLTIKLNSHVTLANDFKVDSTSSILAVYGILEPGPSHNITCNGLTRVYDSARLKVHAANFTSNYMLVGAVTLFAGSIVEYASTTIDQVVSSGYSYSTLIISGTGTKSLAANLPLLYGKTAPFGKILVNSGIFDIKTFTANRATTKPGGELYVANGAFLKIGGLNNFPLNFLTKNLSLNSTVEYNGVDQTVYPQTYGNLLFSTTGIKTAIAPFTVKANLYVANSTLNTNNTTVTHFVEGDFVSTGAVFTGTNYTYTMNGAADQTLNLNNSISKININKLSGTVNLGSDLTVTGFLNFTKGIIRTGTHQVIIPATASVTGAGETTGWVSGNLKKPVATGGAVFKTFEVGDVNYSPAMLLFSGVSSAGDVVARATFADQPEIDYSGLDPVKSVNRYWSLTNAGAIFTNVTAIFNWIATDVDADATTTNFRAGLFNGTNWTLTNTSTALATSIQINLLTSLGDFSVGEIIDKTTWTGHAMTSDWFTPKNWRGLIPSISNPTFIPGNLEPGRVYPVLTSGTAVVKDIVVENAATLTVSSGTLQIAGLLTSANNVIVPGGTVEFNGTDPQLIQSGSFNNNTIKNLFINNDVSLSDVTTLTGTLSVSNGKTFYTNDNLTLKSDASGTARVAPLPVNGSGIATAFITGNVSIERYIPARKAWRLLSAPIKNADQVTIEQAWQEGSNSSPSLIANPNPHPGYGVHIMGGTVENGFDQSPTNSPSLKVYNSVNNTFVPIPAIPGTVATMNSYKGYMIYIRGDRGIDLSQGNNAAVTSTTLRMKGAINTGNVVTAVNPSNFTVLGNPFPSSIDFGTLVRNNVKNSFYVWDPKLAGTNGLGAYVTVSWNSATNTYDITTAASAVSQYIPSGEAILIESADAVNPGTITIRENDKTTNGSDNLFGRPGISGSELRTNLYAENADGSSSLLDGALTTYAGNFSNLLDNDDIKKLGAGSENISLMRNGHLLAIERRKNIEANDTSFLNITRLHPQSYRLEIITAQLVQPGINIFLKDKFDAAIDNTVLNANGATEIKFMVTSDPASSSADRFSIVFVKQVAAPVFSFKSVHAKQLDKRAAIDWSVENESGVGSYDVEHSTDGINFEKSITVARKTGAANNNNYSWLDLSSITKQQYYRIKAVAADAGKSFSRVVKLKMDEIPASEIFSVYPNPVDGEVVSMQFATLDKGDYILQLLNSNGQAVKKVAVQHNGGMLKYNLVTGGTLPAGKYTLQLSNSTTRHTTPVIIK